MSVLQSEALLLCLGASLLWAPLVYLSATLLDRNQALKVSEKIWLAALAAAVLPVLLAPALSSAGISLRTAMPIAAPVIEQTSYVAPVTDTHAAMATPQPALIAIETTEAVEGIAPPSISGETIMKMLGLLYIYGAALAFGLWLMRSLGFAMNIARARTVNDPTLFAVVDEWRQQMSVRKPLRLKSSDRISSVCVYGYFRPVILIPADIRDRVSFEDLVIMCAHELAHIKRGDVRIFAIGAAARILFWFNPFIKRITARAELAAEQGADFLVVQNGVNRRTYAACFVEGLRFAARRPAQAFAALPSFTPFDRKGRRKRLDSILSGTRETALPFKTKLMLGGAGVIAASAVFVQAAVAVHPQPIASDDPVLMQLPVDGKVTLAHGVLWKDKKSGEIKPPHKGIDIAAKRGSPIVAPGDGKVVVATDLYKGKSSWGKVIVIDHGNGMKTRYAHLDSYAVMKGDRVWSGDVIGKVGETGNVTGPHLHFETIIEGKTVDPLMVLGLSDVLPPPQPTIAPEPTPVEKIDPIIAPDPAAEPESIEECCAENSLAGGDYEVGEFEFSADFIGDALVDAREAMADAWEDQADALKEARSAREEVWEDATEAREQALEIAQEAAMRAAKATRAAEWSNPSVRVRAANGALSFNGGEVLSAEQRAEMERSLEQMRKEMKAAQRGRTKAKKASRHANREAKNKDNAHRHAKKPQRQEQRMSQKYAYKFDHEKQILKMRDMSLDNARRMIAQAEDDVKQQMRQAENDLRKSDRSMRLTKLPKKNVEAFKHDVEEARRNLKDHKKERLTDLREAEKTIEEQQREIERLRAELAMKD